MQRLALEWRRAGRRIGLVPTMGYLHAGHLSLVEHARQAVGPDGIVALSIYVNPTQFGPTEDLSRYPRDFRRDARLCRGARVDILFRPANHAMYPGRDSGGYSTYVAEELLARQMEGAARPSHFRGVTTIVAKLFNLVLPDVAVFGAKDYQQAAVVRRMVRDLNFPLRLLVAPTVREADGLAMSSRNNYLNPLQRVQAPALHQAIVAARAAVRTSPVPVRAVALRRRLQVQIERHSEARVDYVEFFNPDTLAPVAQVTRGAHLALAVFFGKTRLIDNGQL